MRGLIQFFIKRHLLVNMIVIATLAVGFLITKNAQREGFPATSLNFVIITTVIPGASAVDVERKVTRPLEKTVRGIDGISRTESTSAENISIVVVEVFDRYSEEEVLAVVDELRRDIQNMSTLPSDLENPPQIELINPARIPALEVFIAGPKETVVAQARQLKEELESADGVSEVIALGFDDPEIRVYVDPVRAAARGVPFDVVLQSIRDRHRTETGGKLLAFPHEQQVVLDGSYANAADVEKTVLRYAGEGGRLLLSDVARVETVIPDNGLIVHHEGEAGVALVVRKRAGADIMRTVDGLRTQVDAFVERTRARVSVYNDGSRLARNRLTLVAQNGLGGIILVLIVLVLFLSRRIAFWVAFGIPFAVFGVLALMPIVGITVNVVSMAGFVLVIGLIVDDAIVVAERIAYQREQGLPPLEAGAKGTHEMALPVLASSLTTIMAFSPMFALGGLPGRFAWAIPTIVVLALSVSLFECFFLLPAHVSGDHKTNARAADKKPEWLLRLEARYHRVLSAALHRRGIVMLGFIALFGLSAFFAATRMQFVLFPQDGARLIFVKVLMPVGTPLLHTEAAMRAVEAQVPKIVGADLETTAARIGHKNIDPASARGREANESILYVYLDDDREFGGEVWLDALKKNLRAPAGARVVFELRRVGPPLGRPVTIHLTSEVDGARARAAQQTQAFLGALTIDNVTAVSDVETNEQPGLTQLRLLPDYEKLAEHGVSLQTLSRTMKASFIGLPVTEIRRGRDAMTIRVGFDEQAQGSLDQFLSMPVAGSRGLVRLNDIVDATEQTSTARIHHLNGLRTTTVTAAIVPGHDITSRRVAAQLEAQLFRQLERDVPQVTASIGGEAKKSKETLGEIPIVALLALCGMLMIVTLLFGSLLQAFFILVAIPLGYVGVIWTFAAHQMPLSFFSMLGAIGLSGVVVNDSIVMVSTLNSDTALAIDEVARRATERLRPVLLTTLTTVAGVMPTAYGFGGRDALLAPMSLALGWGLLFATVITLFLVPALFVIRHDIEAFIAKRRRRPSNDAVS